MGQDEERNSSVSYEKVPLEHEEAPTTTLLNTSSTPKYYFPKRYILIIMCFMGMLICYADRTNFSVAILPMVKQYHWDPATEGFILSAFWYGYAITQVPGGWLADKYSGKTVLSVAVVVWSLCTAATPPAAQAGIPLLVITRIVMGNIIYILFDNFN
jgi:sugar phosphate permease